MIIHDKWQGTPLPATQTTRTGEGVQGKGLGAGGGCHSHPAPRASVRCPVNHQPLPGAGENQMRTQKSSI